MTTFRDLQLVLYKFTINKLWPKAKDKEVRDLVLYEAIETDTFWVEEFDEAYKFIGSDNLNALVDEVANSCEAVRDAIANWYSNPWNFAPGYEKIPVPEFPNLSTATYKRLAEKLTPGITARSRKKLREEKAAWNKVMKEEAKQFKPRLQASVDFINKNDKKGWKFAFRCLTRPADTSMIRYCLEIMLKKDTKKIDQIMKASSPEDMKKLCRKYLSPKDYCYFVFDNLSFLRTTALDGVQFNPFIVKMIAKQLS